MKNFIIALIFGLLCSIGILTAQTVDLPVGTDYEAYFATFVGIVSVTSIITEFIKKLFKVEPTAWVQRIISWLIGIILGMFAWGFHLGMFNGLDWWQALLWGLGAGLASNGLFDTGLIEWLFSLFTKKKTV